MQGTKQEYGLDKADKLLPGISKPEAAAEMVNAEIAQPLRKKK